MKKTLVVLLLALSFNALKSQDLIVTLENDSVNCKITKVDEDFVYFSFTFRDVFRNTLISRDQIKNYQYNYLKKENTVKPNLRSTNSLSKYRIAFDGGFSYMTAPVSKEIPGDLTQYVKELKSGFHYSVDANLFYSKNLGFGLKYVLFKTKNKKENVYEVLSSGYKKYGEMEDDISVYYLGPSLLARIFSPNGQSVLLTGLSIGYVGYKNDAVLIDNDFIIRSKTAGIVWDIGWDYLISNKTAIGCRLSYIFGILTDYELDNGFNKTTIKLEKDSYENISRIDFSIGLRFY